MLGPSGSGKTTLLNLVGGIEEPTAWTNPGGGQGHCRTLNARELTAYRRDQVGFVFQFFNLVPTLTALENVEIIADLAGKDVARRSRAALREGRAWLIWPTGFPARCPAVSSSGSAIARAIVKQPPLLLCDEPTGSLDLVTGRQVLAVLRELAREGQHTVVVVTHNAAIAKIADRVVWLHSGTVARQERVAAPVDAQDLEW